jgi:drug/metabolite transporter (DMT)-like permease
MLAGVFMVAIAAASWGTWSLFLRPTGLPAHITTPLMFAFITVVTLPLVLRSPRGRWDRHTVALLAGNTLFDAVNVISFFAAMRYTSVAIAVLTHYLAPILVAVAAPRIDGTRPGGTRGAAAVALLGLAIMLEPWRDAPAGSVIGALLGLASAFCYAGNVFTVRRLADRIGAAQAMCFHSALAALLMLPFAVSGLATVSWFDLGLLGAGSATIGAMSGVVYVVGLRRIGAARASVLTFAEPFVAVAVGVLVWGEPLRPLTWVGGAFVLAAGIHVARQAR